MAEAAVRFIRKNGRVIPIRAAQGALHVVRNVAVAKSIHNIHKAHQRIKEHAAKSTGQVQSRQGLDALGLGLSVASGAIGAATFGHGIKTFAAGAAVTHAIDAVGISANLASAAGTDHVKQRAVLAAKHEARNLLIGNGIYVAGILASKQKRGAAVSAAKALPGILRAIPGTAAMLGGYAKAALKRG